MKFGNFMIKLVGKFDTNKNWKLAKISSMKFMFKHRDSRMTGEVKPQRLKQRNKYVFTLQTIEYRWFHGSRIISAASNLVF